MPQLKAAGIARAVHQGLLEVICELYASGLVLRRREDYAGARLQFAEYRKCLGEFGLTAATAGRVGFLGGRAKPPSDPADEFFRGPRLEK